MSFLVNFKKGNYSYNYICIYICTYISLVSLVRSKTERLVHTDGQTDFVVTRRLPRCSNVHTIFIFYTLLYHIE